MSTTSATIQLGEIWTLFAPFAGEAIKPSIEELTGIPGTLSFGETPVHPIRIPGGAKMDLAPWLGERPHGGKCAFVYIPFTVPDEKNGREVDVFFGVGADWWYEAWVDGRRAHDTLTRGNQNNQYSPWNHVFRVALKPGKHLLVIRFVSGSVGSTLCVEALPPSEAEGRCTGFYSEGNALVYGFDGCRITVTPWGRDSLRVQVSPLGGGKTSDWALDIPQETSGEITLTEEGATLRNGKISVSISDIPTQKGFMEFYRHHGDAKIPLLSEYDYVVSAHNPGSRPFKPTGDGLFHCELHLAARKGERFYGMGQNATQTLDLKGSVIDLYQRHVKQTIPFVVSSEGYGFLWNNPSLGRVEFGENRTRWIAEGCRQMDYFITAGDDYGEILEHYADATGHAPEFPHWASGFWQCKMRYETQEEFLAVAREFKRRGLPLSVMVIDYLHWDVLGNWKLDPKCWPDPRAMIREMDAQGVRIMISPWTLVDERSENFAHMKKHGLFTGSVDGKKDRVIFGGPLQYQYDPTNPEAASFLWGKWKANYFDLGIRTFWLDPCDDLHEIQDCDQVLYRLGPAKECHAFFVVAHQKNIFDGLRAAGENEVVTLCRNAWAGSQRYGASPAPHDIMSSFEHLEMYMKAALNLAMSGIPWGACEIGGFVTPADTGPHFQELMVRWYQYGVFTPIFRTHGHRKNNEAWNIGGDSYPHIRAAMRLRERLRPYVMEQMRLASAKGLPPMRPVFFDFKEDLETAEIEDQFLFGPDLLAAPIFQYGQRSREVYMPLGTAWIDAWTGRELQGGQRIEAEAPIARIPVYVRGGKPELLEFFSGLYET